MPYPKLVADEDLVSVYRETNSIWKTGDRFAICGQSVHERLKKLGALNPDNQAKGEEVISKIRQAYSKPFLRGESPLSELEKITGMHRSNICRIARRLGLTKRKRKYSDQQKEISSKRLSLVWTKIPHPRGMLGKVHSQEAKDRMSAAGIGRKVKPEIVDKIMRTRFARYGRLAPNNRERASWKAGWREIGGMRIYARSRWEANYARYLEWLRINGSIQKWEHEPETFWFEAIKRGCRSYLPDFRVTENDGRIFYHEVKGWFDARSKTKLKRMAKYHPTVALRLIAAPWFKANERKLACLIPNWERKGATMIPLATQKELRDPPPEV